VFAKLGLILIVIMPLVSGEDPEHQHQQPMRTKRAKCEVRFSGKLGPCREPHPHQLRDFGTAS